MFNVSILCKQSRLFQQKLWYKLISQHMHYSLTKCIKNGNNFNTNVHLVDSNVFAKFDEIPSLPVPRY